MTSKRIFEKLVILGVGLIGGSAALALRQAGQTGTIVGVGRNGDGLQEAIDLGVIDAAAPLTEAVKDADFILVATPVGQFPALFEAMAPHLAPNVVITDAGSTKGDVIAAARTHLSGHLHRFVPGHPIAGAEKSGVSAARPGLFTAKNVVLTPLEENDQDAIAKTDAFWQACGANVCHMTQELHDEIFAAISHLPHLLAFALVADIAQRQNAAQILGFAAGGFRDFSRIAGSSPEMWRDISLANRDALLHEIDAYQAQLTQMRDMIERNDGAALEAVFKQASHARNAWIKNLEK
ncbi:prephenate dehydrogenase [Novimethylophilus kurashikiensis]|uniref:prephenate dehydrogenase n=1 Tax=Novimethylophilus kurashikiensis TaxID=1825523 RepID=A0A2R5F4T2_9PROT|nr:prephenate dehydrogenase/arogenate dehydrogenase family protein [Novimethylophilus kurashikiensis]GBG12718.1 prephenate dehydrogenase [Novimethylophilus kurashikiensis]